MITNYLHKSRVFHQSPSFVLAGPNSEPIQKPAICDVMCPSGQLISNHSAVNDSNIKANLKTGTQNQSGLLIIILVKMTLFDIYKVFILL